MALTLSEDSRDGGMVVVKMSGRFDAAAVAEAEAVLLPRAGESGVVRIILDCADLEYVASAGLRVFLQVVKALKEREARLYVAGMREMVLSVLKMTGFLSFMEARATVEECLA
ncbi:MAG: STAS domain-containing protein [Planctomycetota bacterium]|jgi:anti-sigma B factor antagonist|nr:STAS domain-containing protein [Planctomycetota bacterium]